MRSAAVGFQCPTCVAEGQAGVRAPRTPVGARVPSSAGARSDLATLTLVGANVLVFLVGVLVGQDGLRARFGNITGPVLLDGGPAGLADGEYYRLVTSAFLHAGLIHLALNMAALFTLGAPLEAALGRLRFVALYLLAALGGGVAAFLFAPRDVLGVGASGAIFGLFGAFYVVVRRLGGSTGPILALLGVNLVFTFAVPYIDWRAHLGGLATGTLVAVGFSYASGPRRALLQAVAAVAVLALLLALVVVRAAAVGA